MLKIEPMRINEHSPPIEDVGLVSFEIHNCMGLDMRLVSLLKFRISVENEPDIDDFPIYTRFRAVLTARMVHPGDA
jgi:hypothetical protein